MLGLVLVLVLVQGLVRVRGRMPVQALTRGRRLSALAPVRQLKCTGAVVMTSGPAIARA